MWDKVKNILKVIGMETLKTITYAAFKRSIDTIRSAIEKNIRPSILIYKWLDENRWILAHLQQLPDEAKQELLNLLNDEKFREWIYANIDDIIEYIKKVIQSVIIQVPKPEKEEKE